MENMNDDIIWIISKYIKLDFISKRYYNIINKFKNLLITNLKLNPIKISFDLIKYNESLISINSKPIKINQTKKNFVIDNLKIFNNNLENEIIRNIDDNRKLETKNNNLSVTYYLIQNLKSEDVRFDYKHLF